MVAALLFTAGSAGALLKWYLRGTAEWKRLAVQGDSRSKHAAAVMGGSMFIVGGCWDDRFMNDVLVLDLESLNLSRAQSCPVSCAGHSLIATEGTLLALVGIPSDKHLRVYEFGTTWSSVATSGDIPVATCGHSATLIGKTVWVFGGEDFSGRLVGDLHILELETKKWKRVNASGTIPPPLAFHGASLYDGRLHLFGGRTHSGICGDLFVLNTENSKWSAHSQNGAQYMPGACFGSASIGNKCYTVGGTPQTLLLHMNALKWSVVSAEPRLNREGLSLVHATVQGRSTLVACGSDCTGEFGVFTLESTKSFRRTPSPQQSAVAGKCLVKVGGSTLAYHVPEEGKPAVEIMDTLQMQTTTGKGYLTRAGFRLTASDLVFAGDEVTFHWLPIKQMLSSMNANSCRDFLNEMKIKLIRGEGWLEPSKEIEAEAFTGAPRLWDKLEYMSGHLGQVGMIRLKFKVNESGEVSTISGPAFGVLEFEEQVVLVYAGRDVPLVGFRMEEQINEESLWRAFVLLLALNIKSPKCKPWVVVSDLKEEWHFGWMDGTHMFVSKASSRAQALGIVRDLVVDHDKMSLEDIAEPLSKLPSFFDRASVDVPRDGPPSENPMIFTKVKVEGGMQVTDFNGHTFFRSDRGCLSYADIFS